MVAAIKAALRDGWPWTMACWGMRVAVGHGGLEDGVAVGHGGWENGGGCDHDNSGKALVVIMGSGAGGGCR